VDHHQKENCSTFPKADSLVDGVVFEDAEPDWMSNYQSHTGEEMRKQSAARKWVPKSKTPICTDNSRDRSSMVLSFGGGERGQRELKGAAPLPKATLSSKSMDDGEEALVGDYCSDEDSRKNLKRKAGSLPSSSSSGEDSDGDEESLEPL
jgi:hypothetical protein